MTSYASFDELSVITINSIVIILLIKTITLTKSLQRR